MDLRVGKVVEVNQGNKTVRALFPEDGLVSAQLKVLQAPLTISIGTTDEHTHTAEASAFMPALNDIVLCIYNDGPNADGYVLGVIQ